ncbi:MAG: MFS transporter [Erysipelotrichaceae bacterium]
MAKLNLFSEYRGLNRGNYILFIGRIMTAMGSMVWPILTFILSQRLGLSATVISIVIVIIGIIQMPLTLLGGKLADHYDKKKIINICDMVSVVCCLYCFFNEVNIVSMAIFAFGSIVQSMEWPSYNALVADMTPAKDREKAYSLNYLGTNIGMILSPTIAGILYKNHLNLVFGINGISIFCSTVLIYFFLKVKKVESGNKVEETKFEGNTLSVLKKYPIIVMFLVMCGLHTALYNQYGYLMPLDMSAVHGENGALIYGTVNTMNCIVVVFFTPLITRFFRNIGEIYKIITAFVLMMISYVLFVLFKGIIPVYYLLMLIFTWGEIFNTLAVDPYLTRRVPADFRGRIFGISNISASIFVCIGQLLTGVLYDNLGSTVTWSLMIVLCVCGVFLGFYIKRKDRELFHL